MQLLCLVRSMLHFLKRMFALKAPVTALPTEWEFSVEMVNSVPWVCTLYREDMTSKIARSQNT